MRKLFGGMVLAALALSLPAAAQAQRPHHRGVSWRGQA